MANREQARRHAKEKKKSSTRTPVPPNALRLQLYETERERKITQRLTHDINIVALMVAHDKLRFGKKRLTRFYTALLEVWDSVENKYVSVEDMEKTLIDETGIELFQTKL